MTQEVRPPNWTAWTEASEAAGWEKEKKKKKKEWQTVAVFKTGGGGVYGGISSSNSSSLRPVNQKDLQPHLAVVTRGAATETNSCQRTTSDLSTATV